MLYIIANPLAGGGAGEKNTGLIEQELQNRGCGYKMFRTMYAGHATALAEEASKDPECTAIVALGGDGTFNEVLNGMGDCQKPLGFISAGTGNDFIRAAQIPKDPIKALDIILKGNMQQIDYLLINDRRCINITGTGLDVEILQEAMRLRKRIKGKLSYYVALVKTLITFSFRKYTVSIDGEAPITEEAMMISIANGRMCGGGLPVAPEAQIDDGLIDFILIRKLPKYKIPFLFIKFLKGKLLTLKPVFFRRCKTLEVLKVEPSLVLNMDGELVDMMPFKARICQKVLTIFAPADMEKI